MQRGQRIEFSTFGPPAEVAVCREHEVAPPSAGEVCVGMLYAPINPADLNFMEGTYGKKPALPAVPGNEGVGRVEALGDGVAEFAIGDLVLPLPEAGLWSQWITVRADRLVKLPSRLDPKQAAMLRVNPVTAWLLLTELAKLNACDWVLQNAANSTVGLSVIQIARQRGWKTLNFVRRADAAEACREAGAELVYVDDSEGKEAAKKALGGALPKLAINAVGGESALLLADLLGPRGLHVTIGAMGRQKLSLPNSFLIFKELTFTGFWVTRWMEAAPREKVSEIYATLAQLMTEGTLRLPVEQVYPLNDITMALQHASRPERKGKVLLEINPG